MPISLFRPTEFQVLLFNTNNSIQHYLFICPQFNAFKYCRIWLWIQLDISHFSHSLNVKQFYLSHWYDPIRCYHCNKGVLHTPQSSRTGACPSCCHFEILYEYINYQIFVYLKYFRFHVNYDTIGNILRVVLEAKVSSCGRKCLIFRRNIFIRSKYDPWTSKHFYYRLARIYIYACKIKPWRFWCKKIHKCSFYTLGIEYFWRIKVWLSFMVYQLCYLMQKPFYTYTY